MNTRLYQFSLFFILAFTSAWADTAAKTVVATPRGTRVKTKGGAYNNVTSQELLTLLANKHFLLINVHIPYVGEINKTEAFIPYNEMDKHLAKLPLNKDAMVVLYCRSGPMSKEAAETLVKLGYTNVWKLDRGMIGWEQAGLPIIKKRQP